MIATKKCSGYMGNNQADETMKKYLSLILIGACALSLIGCGSTSTDSTSTDNSSATNASGANSSDADNTSASYPVTIDSYSISSDGSTWEKVDETFEAAPERVVCNNQGSAELMIRLGLADKIVGVAAVFGPAAEDVADEFANLNVISTSYASKELVLGANPDCIIGRGDLFIDGDYGVGTVPDLNASGISTYITHVGENHASFQSFFNFTCYRIHSERSFFHDRVKQCIRRLYWL